LQKWPDEDELFHLYSPDFQKEASFASMEHVGMTNGVVDRLASGFRPGYFIIDDQGVLLAPFLYKGVLHRYKEEKGSWKKVQTLVGYLGQTKTYSYEKDPSTAVQSGTYHRRVNAREGTYGFTHYNESQGLFKMKNEDIVHFTFNQFEEARVFGVEVFHPDGELMGYGAIEKGYTTPHGVSYFATYPVWKDAQDRFYFLSMGGTPQVRVVELIYKKCEECPAPKEPGTGIW